MIGVPRSICHEPGLEGDLGAGESLRYRAARLGCLGVLRKHCLLDAGHPGLADQVALGDLEGPSCGATVT